MNSWSLLKERSRWRLKASCNVLRSERRSSFLPMQSIRSGMSGGPTTFGIMGIDLNRRGKMLEEEIYRLIAEEIETGSINKGLWTKAFSEADGEDNKTKALYIKYRFDQLCGELLIDEDEKRVCLKSSLLFLSECTFTESNLFVIVAVLSSAASIPLPFDII